ncbi:MAG: MFS transporter [Desulfobacterales bacterium]|nr:MFS transporter [Desulfobacterales bacterium]
MTPENAKANIKVIAALTLVHFAGDFYSSFINPLFPLFVEKLNLSLAQVGIIAGTVRLLAFIVQPSVGYLADRYQTRVFILGGLLLSVVFIPLSGVAPTFLILLLCVAAGSIGSAMYHPSVTGMVSLYAGRNAGLSMSIFNTGGTLSFALGPLFVTWYAATFGLEALPGTMVLGLAAAAYLFVAVPQPQSEGLKKLGFFGTLKETMGPARKPIFLIWLVMVLRAVVGQSFMTFMPVMYVSKGYSLVSAGVVFSLFTLAGTISGILSGHLSDRIGFKPVFLTAHILMPLALILLLYLPGNWVYPGAVLAGFFTLATMPLGVVMAQKLAPRGRSMVASLMMGFAYGLGGMISPLVGKLADLFSIQPVLFGVALIPLLSLVFIFRFPNIPLKR